VLLATGSAGLALHAGGRKALAQSAGQLTVVSFGGS
jgi:hypothetical protein